MAAEMRIMEADCTLLPALDRPWVIRSAVEGTTFCGRASSHFSEAGPASYRVLAGFYCVLQRLRGSARFHGVLQGSTGFCRVLRGSARFYRVLQRSNKVRRL